MIDVFIDGSAGTTGLRVADRLRERGDVHLLGIDEELRKDAAERARIAGRADIVFLCLPDEAARSAAAALTNSNTKIIDASTAHRVHPDWAYGLPELSAGHRERIERAARVSVPGCYAMGFALLAYPLVAQGIARPDYPFVCHALSGYSGAGKSAIARYADSARHKSYHTPRQYALGQTHKHLPEMRQVSGLEYPPVFNPTIADYYAGMVVSLPLHARLLQKYAGARELQAFFADYYAGQPLIEVQPPTAQQSLLDGMLDPIALAGRDSAQIFVFGGEERILLAARFDNLGKGASGAAIQCMNILCGLPETTGLVL